MSLHAIDVPVTDLDDDEEDFNGPGDLENTATLFDEDFSNPPKYKTRWNQLKEYFVPSQRKWLNETYELHHFDSSDSFTIHSESDEPDAESPKPSLQKYQFILILVTFLSILFGISALVTNKTSHHDKQSLVSSVRPKPVLSNTTHNFYPSTILISLDGFHPSYISESLTPNLHDTMIHGYGAPYMIPSFPSSTFPNHWTMVTGLYPSEHGIVGNTFFDPILKKKFINVDQSTSLDPIFWGGQPIWQTASFQGVSSAIHMWPGSEVNFETGKPLFVDPYNGTEVLNAKVDRILGWLDLNLEERPELILSYVPTVDSVGHAVGISGKKLDDALVAVDTFIGNLYEGLSDRNLDEIVNVVIVSDHGMAPTSNDRLIYLDDLIELNKIEHIDGWPLFGIRPLQEYSLQEVYEELNSNKPENAHFEIYLKEDMPKSWNFGTTNSKYQDRIAPIWIVPEVGYSVTTRSQMEQMNNDYKPKGVHGYNNTELLMRATFLGRGPYFESKLGDGSIKVKPFYNTEVYDILCDMMGLEASPNNGTGEVIAKSSIINDFVDYSEFPGVDLDEDYSRANSTYSVLYGFKKEGGDETHDEGNDGADNLGDGTSDDDNGAETTVKEGIPAETITDSEPSPTSEVAETDIARSQETSGVATSTTSTDTTLTTSHIGSWADRLNDVLDSIENTFEDVYENIDQAIDDALDRIGNH